MRFGLDRMRRMMTALDAPQQRFRSIHVVGTNGKSSTTRFTAAILERHGIATGAYLSPHLVGYTERIQLRECDVDERAFADGLGRAAWAAERVNRTLSDGDAVTQFELLTATGYLLFAEAGVEVAVVEAGLGARYDATSVIDAAVTALTSVDLEHTNWLGPTVSHIATEKLAVVADGAVLALGAGLQEEVLAIAREVALQRGARLVACDGEPPCPVHAAGTFQRRNFALACTIAREYLAGVGRELEPDAVREAAADTLVPGRFQLVCEYPPTVLDGAHNPAGVLALGESLEQLRGGRPLGVVVGVLDDKDAAAMLDALRPHAARLWTTAAHTRRAIAADELAALARTRGFDDVVSEPDGVAALSAAQQWARESDGVVLATGSIYLVGELLHAVESPEVRP
jgi:dihydrofolate synthase/folylpolyglutamate synthase